MIAVTAILLGTAVWTGFPAGADRRCHAVARSGQRTVATGTTPGWRNDAAVFELLSAALDAGLPPLPAVVAVAAALPEAVGAPLSRAAAMVEVTGDQAWRALIDDPEVGQLAAALARSEHSGAPVAESVRVLAEEVRRMQRAQRVERARRVGVKTAAPLGLCFLPAFFVVAVVPTLIGLLGTVL